MIKAEKANRVSDYILKRSATMTVEQIGPTEFRVAPGEEGKVVRIVRFHPDYGDGAPRDRYLRAGEHGPEEVPRMRGVFMECFAEANHTPCEANVHGLFCSHIHAAIKQLLVETKGEESDESR